MHNETLVLGTSNCVPFDSLVPQALLGEVGGGFQLRSDGTDADGEMPRLTPNGKRDRISSTPVEMRFAYLLALTVRWRGLMEGEPQ